MAKFYLSRNYELNFLSVLHPHSFGSSSQRMLNFKLLRSSTDSEIWNNELRRMVEQMSETRCEMPSAWRWRRRRKKSSSHGHKFWQNFSVIFNQNNYIGLSMICWFCFISSFRLSVSTSNSVRMAYSFKYHVTW